MPAPTQDAVLARLKSRQGYGATWKEIANDALDHGQISAALTALHRRGTINRLTATRDRCAVYVLPEFVAGRPIEEFGAKRRQEWSPDHPCFDGRPILIGDQIQFSDQLHDGALAEGRVINIRDLTSEPGPALLEVDELRGWLIEVGDVLAHTPKRG